MSGAPLVSVVMSVLNDEQYVAATLDSILSQEGVDLEFIVIDDGSADRTGEILDSYAARHPSLRVVHQENTGLTRALICGCQMARGKYIARQDGGGDVSLPGRLRTQMEFLESHPDVVLTSCGTRFVGPEGEQLYEAVQTGNELQLGLQELRINRIRGPSHHGSAMFRRSGYHRVGGYRGACHVAQDLDLWLRLSEIGKVSSLPTILYVACLTPNSISSHSRDAQITMSRVILRCARRRRKGIEDESILNQFSYRNGAKKSQQVSHYTANDAKFNYFIGSILRKRAPRRARQYYSRSLRSWRLFPRAFIALCLLSLRK